MSNQQGEEEQRKKKHKPDGEAFHWISSRVAFKVEESSDIIEQTQTSADARVFHSTKDHQYEVHWHHLQRVLMTPLQPKLSIISRKIIT